MSAEALLLLEQKAFFLGSRCDCVEREPEEWLVLLMPILVPFGVQELFLVYSNLVLVDSKILLSRAIGSNY